MQIYKPNTKKINFVLYIIIYIYIIYTYTHIPYMQYNTICTYIHTQT